MRMLTATIVATLLTATAVAQARSVKIPPQVPPIIIEVDQVTASAWQWCYGWDPVFNEPICDWVDN